ncbi:MAG: amidophosphoribosyltransferase, partial [Burkholderiales bacterium]
TGLTNSEIANAIGADSLIYQDLDALIDCVRRVNPKVTRFEASCFSGEYITGDITPEYLANLEARRGEAARVSAAEWASAQLDLTLVTAE